MLKHLCAEALPLHRDNGDQIGFNNGSGKDNRSVGLGDVIPTVGNEMDGGCMPAMLRARSNEMEEKMQNEMETLGH